jgi:hypothetical protein
MEERSRLNNSDSNEIDERMCAKCRAACSLRFANNSQAIETPVHQHTVDIDAVVLSCAGG